MFFSEITSSQKADTSKNLKTPPRGKSLGRKRKKVHENNKDTSRLILIHLSKGIDKLKHQAVF
jgi:1,2-phenylacetyl-CoA epoxidase PaaB subunit